MNWWKGHGYPSVGINSLLYLRSRWWAPPEMLTAISDELKDFRTLTAETWMTQTENSDDIVYQSSSVSYPSVCPWVQISIRENDVAGCGEGWAQGQSSLETKALMEKHETLRNFHSFTLFFQKGNSNNTRISLFYICLSYPFIVWHCSLSLNVFWRDLMVQFQVNLRSHPDIQARLIKILWIIISVCKKLCCLMFVNYIYLPSLKSHESINLKYSYCNWKILTSVLTITPELDFEPVWSWNHRPAFGAVNLAVCFGERQGRKHVCHIVALITQIDLCACLQPAEAEQVLLWWTVHQKSTLYFNIYFKYSDHCFKSRTY